MNKYVQTNGDTVYIGEVTQEQLVEFKLPEYGSVNFQGNHFFFVKNKNKELIFMYSYNLYNNVCEIHNVCVRSKHIASDYLKQSARELHKNGTFVWLGIDKPERIDLYTQIGFVNPYLTNVTPLGREFPYYFIGFNYEENKGETKRARKMAQDLFEIKRVLEIPEPARTVAYLNYTDYEGIYNHILQDSSEIGGRLDISLKENTFQFLSKFKGSPSKWSVQIPCSSITFHTHPYKAYDHYKYGSGLPSTDDYVHDISCANYMSLVFTIEGIYVLQYHKLFRKLLELLKRNDGKEYRKYIEAFKKHVHTYDSSRTMQNISATSKGFDLPAYKLYEDVEWRARLEKLNKDVIHFVNSLPITKELLRDYDIRAPPHMFERAISLSYISGKTISRYVESKRHIPIYYYRNL